MDHEIENHHLGYRPMIADRPDPWDTSASARADLMRRTARLAERERSYRLMPEDEQEDAEPSAYEPRSGAGACAGTLFAVIVFGAFCACGAWALFGPFVGGSGR